MIHTLEFIDKESEHFEDEQKEIGDEHEIISEAKTSSSNDVVDSQTNISDVRITSVNGVPESFPLICGRVADTEDPSPDALGVALLFGYEIHKSKASL